MRKRAALCAILALAVIALLVAFLPRKTLPGWETPEGLSRSHQRQILRELSALDKDCWSFTTKNRANIDNLEAHLIEKGWLTEDTSETALPVLGNPDLLRNFWSNRAAGKACGCTLLRVSAEGNLGLTRFFHQNGEDSCVLVRLDWEGEGLRVLDCDLLPVYDMELADWDVFYYRLYPEDIHYIDYMQVRLSTPDPELQDLTRRYILPIGYQMVNFFLVDWREGDWGDLSFADVFSYFYEMDTGEAEFSWIPYKDPRNPERAVVPGELFEKTLLARLPISREDLRALAGYEAETGGYPWRTFFGDDLTTRSFPLCEPQVTAVMENSDGTLTLQVDVGSPEVKTNRLFSHKVVLRPMENGGAQYLSNRVTYVGQWGLPFRGHRLDLS